MKHLGDDLPAAVEVDQGQQVDEVFGSDRALELGQCRHRASDLDGQDFVGTHLAKRGRRRSGIDDREVLFHAQNERRVPRGAGINGLGMKDATQPLGVAVVEAIEVVLQQRGDVGQGLRLGVG